MILENLEEVNKRILCACEKAGRDPKEVTLIAVSKTKPASMIEEAYGAGVRDFGENKVQELCEKYKELPQDIKWHMIGHLQRNKVKQIIGKTVLIHSVDSLRLAEQIEEEAGKQDLIIDILLEINVAEEDSKFGFKLEEAESAILKIATFPHVRIKGLMTIAPFVEKSEENRSVFKKLRQFYVDMQSKNIDNVNMSLLSMGMTGDYEVAIEEGATLVRVGTGIFGTRYKIGENEV
ncbi:YggS family pyridoxal phosphate enzyme [Lacrimispora xylanolytica]|uniref:Pyridoxal phosphate homeostasis protein n=1 Tax=Lacrimispora xylanolytica TaxID=29375 RepID=A0ABY7A6T6_9FIRM|nr:MULTISPECIES: YggS family pyridoxal phosphate-dependent enzyme [Lacrimispora]MBS5959006.1 YggS family pyridoxal phosphate-dependent enzyme [Clostridiales bacterium]WAJ22060.1 YggS family pyridoxal phosphate-dependent enzyme [Lacrimispora xylanolytica]